MWDENAKKDLKEIGCEIVNSIRLNDRDSNGIL